jgi:hypothetical protein
MENNFDLKKFLLESKAIQNLNPILKKESLNESDLRSKIKEMIIAELDHTENEDEDYSDFFFDVNTPEDDLYEAKKDKEEEDVEDIEVEDTEEVTPDDAPSDETGGGLEDIAADMEGNEGEIMNHLMSALKMAKGMNNEKLETQIGNTLKFFVSEYIGGGE